MSDKSNMGLGTPEGLGAANAPGRKYEDREPMQEQADALEAIACLLERTQEWGADTLDSIVLIIASTGRELVPVNTVEPQDASPDWRDDA